MILFIPNIYVSPKSVSVKKFSHTKSCKIQPKSSCLVTQHHTLSPLDKLCQPFSVVSIVGNRHTWVQIWVMSHLSNANSMKCDSSDNGVWLNLHSFLNKMRYLWTNHQDRNVTNYSQSLWRRQTSVILIQSYFQVN